VRPPFMVRKNNDNVQKVAQMLSDVTLAMPGRGSGRRNRRRRNRAARVNSSLNLTTFTGAEHLALTSVSNKGGIKSFSPGTSGLSRLDSVAKGFERYTIRRFRVEFVPSSPVLAGTVCVAAVMDPTVEPTPFAKLLSVTPKILGSVSKAMMFSVSPSSMSTRLFVSSSVASSRDIALTSSFSLLWAFDGLPTDVSTTGYLKISYDVQFEGPVIST